MEMTEKKRKLALVTDLAGLSAPAACVSIYTKLTSTEYANI